MRRLRFVLLLGAVVVGGCTRLTDKGEYEGYEEACAPGETRACYTGPAGTEGVGVCKGGTQVCTSQGVGFGSCVGEVTPSAESCSTGVDEDCDGKTLDAEGGCVCEPMVAASCYSGPKGTLGVGPCMAGVHVCNELGTGFGACVGEVPPHAEICGSPQDESCNGEAGCSGAHVWSESFGAGAIGNGVATDGASNILLTGDLMGGVDFGGASLISASAADIFVAKVNASGSHVWSKRFGDTGSQNGSSVAADSEGNVVLTGGFTGTVDFGDGPLFSVGSSDIFVAKLNAAGGHVWSRRFGDGSTQLGSDVVIDQAGDVLLTGSFDGSVDFGGGQLTNAGFDDVFVAKFDSAGGHRWSKRFGDGSVLYVGNMATDGAGSVVLTGSFEGTVDFGGGPLASAGYDDIFVAKLDASGGHVWSKRFGDGDPQTGQGVATDSAGNVVITGLFMGTVDFGGGPLTSAGEFDIFVVKLSPSGSHVWSKRFGDEFYQRGLHVAIDGADTIGLTGIFKGSVDFGGGSLMSAGSMDLYVVKLDPSGGHLWSHRFGEGGYQVGRRMATDSAGNIVVTGLFEDVVDFGGGPLKSAQKDAWFVAKLAP